MKAHVSSIFPVEDRDADLTQRAGPDAVGWAVRSDMHRYQGSLPHAGSEAALRAALDQRRRTENLLRLLCEASRHLLSAGDPDALVRGLFEKIREPLGVDACFHFVVDESGGQLRLQACAGLPAATRAPIERLAFGQGICGTAAAQRRAIHAGRIQQSDEPMVQLAKGMGLRAYACQPMLAHGHLLGTLAFASRRKDAFTPDELDFLRTVSQFATAAYERLRHIGKLREMDQRKDAFLATLAHELRGPLAPLANTLHVLKKQSGAQPVCDACALMERQLAQMVRLVDDLLDMSRISRDKISLHPEKVRLDFIVEQAVEAVRPLAVRGNLEVRVELPADPILLHADAARLAQVFGNLLTNACKYTDAGGRVHLTARRDDGEAVISVRDSGIGIPPDQLASVFEIFAQVQSARGRSQGGLGIGLALVKRLVGLHGGSVQACSAGAGQGSEFVVRLPAWAPGRAAGASRADTKPTA